MTTKSVSELALILAELINEARKVKKGFTEYDYHVQGGVEPDDWKTSISQLVIKYEPIIDGLDNDEE